MTTREHIEQAEKKMQQSIEAYRGTLGKIRTGRASPGLLDTVMVEYYGSVVPVNQVANVSALDARTLSVQAWEKDMVPKVEKAIRDSDLGLNPATVGELIRVPMPPMTEERRRELTRVVRAEAENARISVRNVRRDANDAIRRLLKDKEITEDEQKRSEAQVQKLTDDSVAQIDSITSDKETELMSV